MISIHRDCGIQQAANDKGGSRCSIQHIFSDSSLFVAIHDEIVQRLQNVYPVDLRALKDRVINAHAAQWKECPPGILFNHVAFSLSGLSVQPNLPSEPDQNSLTWRQLASRGLLELSERDQVLVPFVAILALLQSSDLEQSVRHPFMNSLREVKDLLDVLLTPRWEQWERFGSHFHCVRMNALLALGRDSVSLATLFPGAQYSSFAQSSLFVTLRPAKVMKAQVPLSVDSDLESISGTRFGQPKRSEALFRDVKC
jgi:hypothetical protein